MPKPAKNQGAPPSFFGRELDPEPALTLATARRLCPAARLLFSKQPWQLLEESDVVFVDAGPGRPLLACSAIGHMGQVFALMAYVGAEGYRFFRRLHSDETMTTDDFLAEQNTISVEFVARRELRKPDRELIAAAGPEWARSPAVPLFRASRPGFHPWYPNEQEARLLVECLDAMNWFLEHLPDHPVSEYWQNGTFPKLVRNGEGGFRVELTGPPRAPIPMPQMPRLETHRIKRILARGGQREGALEAEEFFCAAEVGAAHERKSCVRIGLAVDARTGIAYPPAVVGADARPGELLGSVILQALESGAPLPAHIYVRNPEAKRLLEPLAAALGTEVAVRQRLPALDGCKRGILQMMRAS